MLSMSGKASREVSAMTVRVAINGFGRIGRDVLRCALERADSRVEIVAVNDLTSAATLAHLLTYDSTYGRLALPVAVAGPDLVVGGRSVRVCAESNLRALPWADLGVDVVVESTGRCRHRNAAARHLTAGARKVVVAVPGTQADLTLIVGVNDDRYDPAAHHVISNASATTHCVASMIDVLHRPFHIRHGLITTIDSHADDPAVLGRPQADLRRARSATVNLIPTRTGVARSVGEVIPALAGRLEGVAIQVPPTGHGSLADLVVELDEITDADTVNAAFAEAAAGRLKTVLRYTTDPIVSHDIVGDPASCIFDAGLTTTKGRLVQVFGWYDNEWGHANRTLDLVELIGGMLR
jgi:glyceraldehyde 3-phosphate dehydrogenase